MLGKSRDTLNIVGKYLGSIPNKKKVNRPLACSKSEEEVNTLSSEYRIDYPAVVGSLI